MMWGSLFSLFVCVCVPQIPSSMCCDVLCVASMQSQLEPASLRAALRSKKACNYAKTGSTAGSACIVLALGNGVGLRAATMSEAWYLFSPAQCPSRCRPAAAGRTACTGGWSSASRPATTSGGRAARATRSGELRGLHVRVSCAGYTFR